MYFCAVHLSSHIVFLIFISESHLQSLTRDVKTTMRYAFAEGSLKNLQIQWQTFFIFCEYFKLPTLPASINTLCAFAQFLSRSFKSVNSIRNYLSGVKLLHTLLELDYPSAELIHLRLLLRGLARKNPHVPKQALPLTPEILLDIFQFLDVDKVIDVVFWAVLLLMFFLMSRKSNMLANKVSEFDPQKHLTRKDVSVYDDMLIVHFKWSKTRQFGHSRNIPILNIPGSPLCPVKAYSQMSDLIKLDNNKSAFCYLDSNLNAIPLTYYKFQKKLRCVIDQTGRDGSLFSSHSCRRGACSFAFKSNVRSELIKYHGDWLSPAYLEYLSYDFDQLLSVSDNMRRKILNLD